jgi:hypothetical protein
MPGMCLGGLPATCSSSTAQPMTASAIASAKTPDEAPIQFRAPPFYQ